MDFRPDWVITGTIAQLQETIGNGFVWKGPGWYLTSNEQTCLIVPREFLPEEKPFAPVGQWDPEQEFMFCSFTGDPTSIFGAIAKAPVRAYEEEYVTRGRPNDRTGRESSGDTEEGVRGNQEEGGFSSSGNGESKRKTELPSIFG